MSHFIDLANASFKFLLPDGGILLDDKELRALDDSMPLRLPHPFIALEYSRHIYRSDPVPDGSNQPSKALVFAREREEGIAVSVCCWVDAMGIWAPMPDVWLPKTGYLDRSHEVAGLFGINMLHHDILQPSDYLDELYTLLSLLNALACSNIYIDRSEPKKKSGKNKAALPFDAYHILTIDIPSKSGLGAATGGHRSPREHLRRGHIRRLSDGRRIWVNATVVAAGRGAGVVTKDYRLRARSAD